MRARRAVGVPSLRADTATLAGPPPGTARRTSGPCSVGSRSMTFSPTTAMRAGPAGAVMG
jgi:hypothetical protein